MREGFVQFGKSMRGYMTNDAILHAPESRTSSPVRIPRDHFSLEHVQIKGLYPCGEGQVMQVELFLQRLTVKNVR